MQYTVGRAPSTRVEALDDHANAEDLPGGLRAEPPEHEQVADPAGQEGHQQGRRARQRHPDAEEQVGA